MGTWPYNVSVTRAIQISLILTFTCATIIYYCSAETHDADTFVSLLYCVMQWNVNNFSNHVFTLQSLSALGDSVTCLNALHSIRWNRLFCEQLSYNYLDSIKTTDSHINDRHKWFNNNVLEVKLQTHLDLIAWKFNHTVLSVWIQSTGTLSRLMQPAPVFKGCWVPSPALSGSHKGLSSVGWEGMTLEDFGSVCLCVCVQQVCLSVRVFICEWVCV